MALKENIKSIQQELSTEEQFLEGIIKSERFIKKYKNPLIILAILVCVGLGGYAIFEFMNERNLKISNAAYSNLLKNPDDKESLATLESKNKTLFDSYTFQRAILQKDKKALEVFLNKTDVDPMLKQLAIYEDGKSGGILLSHLKFALDGYELLKQNKFKEAKAEFAKIPLSSPLTNVVKNLEHYGQDNE